MPNTANCIVVEHEDFPYSLESYIRYISLEDMGANFLIESFKGATSKLSCLFNNINESILTGFTKLSSTKPNYKNINYINVGETLIPVPQNFKGMYLPYFTEILNIQSTIYPSIFKYLDTFSLYLADFITNKDTQRSSISNDLFCKSINKDTSDYNTRLKKYYTSADNIARARIKNVIERIEDMVDITDIVKKIESNNNISNLKKIDSEILKICHMLDIISKNNDIEAPTINKASITNISIGAYELGRLIESVAIYEFKVDVSIKCLNSLIDLLNKSA